MAQYRVATYNPSIEQSIIKAGESIRKGFADRAEAERLNKERLRLEQEREIGKYTTQFDRLGKIDPTGNITYDTNMRNFFNTQVDNYVQIKNAMEAGDIDLNEGAQMLNQINGYIDQYKTLAPKIMGQVGYYKQLVKDGKLSNANSSQMAHLLGKLSEGSSDISIEEINGQVYISDNNSNGTGESYNLSLNELEAILADEGASLVEEKLEAEDLGTDAAFELIDGIAGISQGVERSDTDDTGRTVKKKTFLNPDTVFDLYKNQEVFKPQLSDPELMNKMWVDNILADEDFIKGKGIEDTRWDPNDPAMREIAETWLIEKSISDNVPIDRLTAVIKKPPTQSGDGSGDDAVSKAAMLDYLNKIDDLEFEEIAAIGPGEEGRPYLDLNAVAEQISRPPFGIRVSEAFKPTGYAKQARTFTKSVKGEDRKVTVFDNATEDEIKAAMKFLETGLNFPASANVIATEEETSDETDTTFAQ